MILLKDEETREGIAKIVKLCANKPSVYTPEMCAMDLMEYLHPWVAVIKGVDRPYPNVGYPFRATVALKKGLVVFIPEE